MLPYDEWCTHNRVEPDTLWVITHAESARIRYMSFAGKGSLAVLGTMLRPGTIIKLVVDDGTSAPAFIDILGTWPRPRDVWLGWLVPLESQEDA